MFVERVNQSTRFCSKFGYVSINNIFAFRFDISCYSQWILLNFGYVYIDIVASQYMSSDYFILQNCAHTKLISIYFRYLLLTSIESYQLLRGQYSLYNLIHGLLEHAYMPPYSLNSLYWWRYDFITNPEFTSSYPPSDSKIRTEACLNKLYKYNNFILLIHSFRLNLKCLS
jgi:hypothetical protein